MKAATKKEMDSKAEKTTWQAANVTFDPSHLSSRRMSTQMETRPSTVTFDLITNSHDDDKTLSQSEKRGSRVTFDPDYHDNRTSASTERRPSVVTFDDRLDSSNHDNQLTSAHNGRPLTSGSSNSKLTSAGEEEQGREEEMEEGGSGESGDEGEGEEEECDEVTGALSQQSELV